VPRSLPDNWSNLSVSDLGIKGSFPNNLKIKRVARSKILYASWLPDAEADARPNQGRSGKTNKRVPLTASMRTSDPFEAGKRAVEWVGNQQRAQEAQKAERSNNLCVYWDSWFANECRTRETKRNFTRWKRDERLKWEGAAYGIKHQPWALKSVEDITALDFEDYWRVLDARRTAKNDMGGTKAAQKTLIRKLLREARSDYPRLSIPDFPTITRQTEQVVHLKKSDWERLVKKVVELSGGAARKQLSAKQYEALQFSKAKRQSQRNWVDVYDALHLLWFFHLRAEDLPRLQAEWFSDTGDDEIICLLEETKGNRHKHETRSYRVDAPSNWRRLAQRKPSGYLVFPHIVRPKGNPAESSVLDNFNDLLRTAMDACDPPIPSREMTATNIRHTAFRLMLEEVPELGRPPLIHSFAENGMTSAAMLERTYLKYIDQENTAKKVRAQTTSSEWSLQKRTEKQRDV